MAQLIYNVLLKGRDNCAQLSFWKNGLAKWGSVLDGDIDLIESGSHCLRQHLFEGNIGLMFC